MLAQNASKSKTHFVCCLRSRTRIFVTRRVWLVIESGEYCLSRWTEYCPVLGGGGGARFEALTHECIFRSIA